jgi:hypothetical protein
MLRINLSADISLSAQKVSENMASTSGPRTLHTGDGSISVTHTAWLVGLAHQAARGCATLEGNARNNRHASRFRGTFFREGCGRNEPMDLQPVD